MKMKTVLCLAALLAVFSFTFKAEGRSDRKDMQIVISVSSQTLSIYSAEGEVINTWPVSTATAGTGSRRGSNKTPLGLHRIKEKIGDGQPRGMIFKARRPTGELAEIHTAPVDTPLDLVTTRILWLDGLEPGKNRGGSVDSHSRYIYIHGTPEEGLIGSPASHGCIRMKNDDVLELFDLVDTDTRVNILP